MSNTPSKYNSLNVALDAKTKRYIREESAKLGVSMSQYVRLCIAYYIDAVTDK